MAALLYRTQFTLLDSNSDQNNFTGLGREEKESGRFETKRRMRCKLTISLPEVPNFGKAESRSVRAQKLTDTNNQNDSIGIELS